MRIRNQFLHYFCLIGALLGASLALSACHKNSQPPAVLERSMRVPPEVIAEWKAKLSIDNIQLVQQGWQLQITIPVDNLFMIGTSELTPPASRILGEIAACLRKYLPNTDSPYPVYVVGHSDITHTRKSGLAMSKEHAQIVSSFLWHHGIPVGRMKVTGVGSVEPIADSSTRGMAKNRRIVIYVH